MSISLVVSALIQVSTHSHPKVAAEMFTMRDTMSEVVSTHSHPKVAAISHQYVMTANSVSTHSHPKVAA